MTIEQFLHRVRNPQTLTGREINVVRKAPQPGQISVCLVFPDTYEIGMSHNGLKILYHRLNAMDDVRAERCFLPDPETLPLFLQQGMPLFSLENRRPLAEFDLIGFSLLSELNFTNVLQVMEAAGLPLRRRDRGEGGPLIAAGSIAASNPEPLREFIDLFAFGDGEVLFPDILAVVRRGREAGLTRVQVLRELDRVPGLYAPECHPLRQEGVFLVPEMDGRQVHKRIAAELPDERYRAMEIVPIGNTVFDRLNVEVARGCPQNCRFCQAGNYYAPFRWRGAESCRNFITHALRGTGFESFSLASLSSGDYPYLDELLRWIPGHIAGDVSFSVPSLRPSTLSPALLKAIAEFRRTGLTIVPEAGSERLRRVINKNVSDAEIFAAVETALDHHWDKIKLYFMIGLPGETAEDIEALAVLLERIVETARARKRKIAVHASFSAFVPKPHTPLQWAARAERGAILATAEQLKRRLGRYRQIDIDVHLPEKGIIETILARGDARVGDLLEAVFRRGERYTAWDHHFHFPVWEEEIARAGLGFLLDELPEEAVLPWDFIAVGRRREHLLDEYRRARLEQPTPACESGRCAECRGCLFPVRPLPPPAPAAAAEPPAPAAQPLEYVRTRIVYEKSGDFRFFSHLSLMHYLERLLRRSGLQWRVTEGFHPRIKLASLPPLPVGAAGYGEVVEVFLQSGIGEEEALRRLQAAAGEFVFHGVRLCADRPGLMKDLRCMHYEITGADPMKVEAARVHLGGEDTVRQEGDVLFLGIAAIGNGVERLARFLRVLDPGREETAALCRRGVEFAG